MKNIYVLLLILLSACGKVEFSPNQKFDSDTPTELNKQNIDRLLANKQDDTIRFVLTGDTQRAYSHCEDMVRYVNGLKGVDFVLLDGDISDFGLYQEMEWINRIYSKLQMPYIAILGNHDVAANGKKVYNRMYGEENFCFIYGGIKFVCHDSNSREYNFNGSVPNIDWLRKQFLPEAGVSGYIAVSHVPAFTTDFDPKLVEPYASVVTSANRCLASLSAHVNNSEVNYPFDEQTPFIVANTVAEREFYVIDIVNGKLSYNLKKF